VLKIRIIPVLLHKNHGLVKGVGFRSWRRIGTAVPAIKVYESRQVDELIFLDIAATPEKRMVDHIEIDQLADECSMPLTVGGGVRTTGDFHRLLRAGADKVSVNTGAIENPELIDEAARLYGAQCVVASIDFRRRADGRHEVYGGCGAFATGKDPVAWAKEVADRGAGEILLTSIDRDGTMTGYDTGLIRRVAESVPVPVIAAGGAGNYEHMRQAVSDGKADALAAASIFHFTEQTPVEAKRYLAARGFNIRI